MILLCEAGPLAVRDSKIWRFGALLCRDALPQYMRVPESVLEPVGRAPAPRFPG